MTTRPVLEGAMTALVTPMKDGKVDFDALGRLVDWQITSGIDALVAVGTTGESATLDFDEHIAVIAHTVKVAAGRVPVIAGAGGNATAEALELTRRSADAGAAALLHVTPYYNRPSQDGLFRHFEAIARATTLPIILYNVPTRTGCDLLPDTVARLAAIDNIVAIKEATGNLVRASELIARTGNQLAVISGDDATTFPLYALGGKGVISVVSNVAPARMAEMWDAAVAGNWSRAREIHYSLRVLNQLLFAEPSPAPTKACLHRMGRIGPELRPPIYPVTAALAEQLEAELAAQGLL
ncbi:MAG: 4-hydroxy-tetrahydrodipicolinate synthase [Kofleriaceae bacterium]|nr:4-hydroxy-tetrahydrodipicolinate synthase [Kofleriaceae bacterium]MCL4228901.1 4-hydroxy-tetrahydrodipicolinate synthase [Myxococcales bacterium]